MKYFFLQRRTIAIEGHPPPPFRSPPDADRIACCDRDHQPIAFRTALWAKGRPGKRKKSVLLLRKQYPPPRLHHQRTKRPKGGNASNAKDRAKRISSKWLLRKRGKGACSKKSRGRKAFLSPQPRSKNEWNHDGWKGEERRRCCQWWKKPSSLSPGSGKEKRARGKIVRKREREDFQSTLGGDLAN